MLAWLEIFGHRSFSKDPHSTNKMSDSMESSLSEKQAKARRVFGDAIVDDMQMETSLTYSPSPARSTNPNLSTTRDGNGDSFSSEKLSTATSEKSGSSVLQPRQPRSGPFDKVICEPTEDTAAKENNNASNDSTLTSEPSMSHAEQQKAEANDVRMRLQRLRSARARSPLRHDLVKRTQAAINKASGSVNNSINAARKAKEASLRQRSHQTAKSKQEWLEEKQAVEAFNRDAESNRLEMLALQRTLSSKVGKTKAKRHIHRKIERIESIDQESQFKSAIYRDHKKKLREEEEARRRQSLEARAKIRKNHRIGAERLQLNRIEEDHVVFQERHESSLALRAFSNKNAESRRKSFSFRLGDARRIRKLHEKMEADRLAKEHESYELKWKGERDADETKRRMEQERRESLIGRGQAHQQYLQTQRDQKEQAARSEHESFELKWKGEKDTEEYKRALQQQRRESFALRNKEAVRRKQEWDDLVSRQKAQEHASYELKWAGEKDAEAYKQQLSKEEQQDFALRNKEGALQRKAEEEQRALELQREHESLELKWAGERDADAYKQKLEEERRMSLHGRNLHARRLREKTIQEESERREAEHASYELKWAGEKDAEAYQRSLEQKRRESLAGRNRELANHARTMQELREIAREKETESLVLKWAGDDDAKAYLAKLEEERRQSLQLRGKQVLHQRAVESEQRDEELRRSHEDQLLKSADQKDVEAFRKELADRDRASLQYRRKEAQIQRLEEEERELKRQEEESANEQLESLARADVEEYLNSCKQRRRLSLAFRARETRRHVDWRRKMTHDSIEQRRREVRNRLLDSRSVEQAKRREKTEKAIEALKHASCSFNPSGMGSY